VNVFIRPPFNEEVRPIPVFTFVRTKVQVCQFPPTLFVKDIAILGYYEGFARRLSHPIIVAEETFRRPQFQRLCKCAGIIGTFVNRSSYADKDGVLTRDEDRLDRFRERFDKSYGFSAVGAPVERSIIGIQTSKDLFVVNRQEFPIVMNTDDV
jgi:hypothetical protein